MDDQQNFLSLFEIYWYYHKILSNQSSPSPTMDPNLAKPDTQIEKPSISPLQTFHRRSLSDESTFKSNAFSPSSVLLQSKLNTIPSEKEKEENPIRETDHYARKQSRKASLVRQKKFTKSLSDLEFEELKGFLDLGFVFPEEEMDSRLISIVPGLQRLGQKQGEEEPVERDVSRPYLSEAWTVDQEEENPLMNWRIPAVGDAIDMKDHLRCWAHHVASTVR